MRFNLLFHGVPESGQKENTEDVLTAFLEKEIVITSVSIQVSCRLGSYHENQRKNPTP